jgi:hypothetical protein
MKKYKQNLKVENNKVYSYNTHVASIIDGTLLVFEEYAHYSQTTTKHLNYVATELKLKLEIENH